MSGTVKSQIAGTKPAVVIPIGKAVKGLKSPPRQYLRWFGRQWVQSSALLCVVLPTLLATVYLGFIASDRFAVEVKFAVRGPETAAIDALGVFGLGGTSNMGSDSYILVDFIRSRTMFEEVSKTVDLTSLYSSPSIDWFSRLNPSIPIERLVEYWSRMTSVTYEPATGIIRVEVSAFDRDSAVNIATATTRAAETLINRLSTESRHDALKAATVEVDRAEQRQRMLRTAMRKFREREQISDPARRAGAQQEMIEKSRHELQRIETELQAARGFMKEDAPSIVVLRNQKAAVQKQVDTLLREVGGDGTDRVGKGEAANSVASMLSSYEELEAERIFAEKAFITSLASLERARFEADRKQRFLAIFEKPNTPEEARYPARIKGIFVTLVSTLLLWGLGVLIVLGIREHT